MTYSIKISSLAQIEFEESILFYDKNLVGLGLRFSEDIYEAFNSIVRNPEAYPIKKSKFREYILEKFPFIIVYEVVVQNKTINILHIFHTSRNPKFKFTKS